MKIKKELLVISILILILAALAAGTGVFWQGEGESYTIQSQHGEAIKIQGHGLYKNDSVSYAAQAVAQDWVTLLLALPMLLISLILAARGSLRGKLLLTGTLGYLLYTYTSYVFLVSFNQFFLMFVALFSLCLFGFILAFTSINAETLKKHFSASAPRIPAAVFFFILAAFLLFSWLSRILPATLAEGIPVGLESYTTLVIQALDLGLVVPIAIFSGILLLRRKPLGYLLGSVVMIKGFGMFMAIFAMILAMIKAGVSVAVFEVLLFPALGLINAVLVFLMLKSLQEKPV